MKSFVGLEIKTEEDYLILSQKDFISEWHGKCETSKNITTAKKKLKYKTIPKTKCYPYREIVDSLLLPQKLDLA